ncbi:hypothetical protein CAter282_2451 [Collimonas arenae]|uniref:Uncharacterized protein n=1 Tax=Collimonas arenae TaxID=279058 RepID=A0A127PRF7_9BURK|nr:hypothetical protein CAter10_2702 [Collimonas arenae]AMP10197.1 hypothetical protein CAter282_2451 [Collimonas arenae]
MIDELDNRSKYWNEERIADRHKVNRFDQLAKRRISVILMWFPLDYHPTIKIVKYPFKYKRYLNIPS